MDPADHDRNFRCNRDQYGVLRWITNVCYRVITGFPFATTPCGTYKKYFISTFNHFFDLRYLLLVISRVQLDFFLLQA